MPNTQRLSSRSLVTYRGQARSVIIQNTNPDFRDEKVWRGSWLSTVIICSMFPGPRNVLLFCVAFFLLSTIILRFIHVAACSISSFLIIVEQQFIDRYTIVCFFLMKIQGDFRFCLSQIKLLVNNMHKFLFSHMLLFFWDLGAECLDQIKVCV